MVTKPVAFFAYPSEPAILAQTVNTSIEIVRDRGLPVIVTPWEEMDIAGQFIATAVLRNIEDASVLVADITFPNFNVFYEIGFAIGRRKPVALVRNKSLDTDKGLFDRLGVFDTLGYKSYENSEQLSGILAGVEHTRFIDLTEDKDNSAPVYLLESKYKTDWTSRISSRLKKARLAYRSFDPVEQSRLSATDAISNILKSHGVVLPLLDKSNKGAKIHNLYGAFMAGLSDGFGVQKILIQQSNDDPVPLDYRDFVTYAGHPAAVNQVIAEFAPIVAEQLQSQGDLRIPKPESFLQRLDLGASSAENEIRYLGSYYLDVDAYRRTSRGEIRIVVGRKGSGKTALFFRLRDEKRRSFNNVVLDLKPDGYKLRKFKELVISLLQEGTAEHLIEAFWEYLLLLEISFKIVGDEKSAVLRNPALYQPYHDIKEFISLGDGIPEGDFSERMSGLIDSIADEYQQKYGEEDSVVLSNPQVTELIQRYDLNELYRLVEAYLGEKESIWLLFDNLDKGWPTTGVSDEDILIIRCLLEATRKIERRLNRKDVDAHTVVFVRNDVYETLVEKTSDRGKESRINLDWSDPDLLRELIRRRLVFNNLDDDAKFDEVWSGICVSHIDGEESFDYLIDRCLMRPRFLIDLINHCKGYAVNLGHEKVGADDIKKGLETYSHDLVTGIGLEIQDVSENAPDVLYALIACQKRVRKSQLISLLEDARLSPDSYEEVIWLLIWFGVLGLILPNGDITYIHTVHYNSTYMKGLLNRLEVEDPMFYINPAFWPSLGIG